MMRRVPAFIVLVVLSPVCIAQTDKPGQPAQARKDVEKAATPADYTLPGNRPLYFQRSQTEIPSGDGAWVIEVETSGGYVPTHRLMTVTSKGRVTIEDSKGTCSFEVEGGFPEIDRLVGAANEAGWGEPILQPEPTSVCNDCRLNKLTLNGRGADGTTYGHAAYWNDFTFVKLKREAAAIASAVEKIKRECPQGKALGSKAHLIRPEQGPLRHWWV